MDASVTQVRSVPPLKQPRNPISRTQVEAVISRTVAGFSVLFSVQALLVLFQPNRDGMLPQIEQANPAWLVVSFTALYATLIGAIVASFVGRFVHATHGIAAVVYFLAIVTWPLAITNDTMVSSGNHWLYFLLTGSTAMAAVAFPLRIAVTYLGIAPLIYCLVRITPAGGSVTVIQALLDGIYSVILGGAALMIVTMLRQAASSVDNAQAAALDRYGHAVRQHATEVERVQVDAIVHDSVLTTLLTAARAFTSESMALSATNAGNAIEHLHAAALVVPDDGTTVRLRDVATRIQNTAGDMSPPFDLRLRDIGPRSMPIQAAEAVYSAARQAMVNSLQHGGRGPGIERWLSMYGVGIDGIQVDVGDTGAGFDLESVPTERLGVRVSIIERVANAGGSTRIFSAPQQGTVVTICWPYVPQEESSAAPSFGADDGALLGNEDDLVTDGLSEAVEPTEVGENSRPNTTSDSPGGRDDNPGTVADGDRTAPAAEIGNGDPADSAGSVSSADSADSADSAQSGANR
ncbi:MAG: hypothetical protein JWQ43_1217 [Glaciihabitans sp.]|nr:hypothetical protein [Glaciihabitans sp.]